MNVLLYFVESSYPLEFKCEKIDHKPSGLVEFVTKNRIEYFPVHRISSIVVKGEK